MPMSDISTTTIYLRLKLTAKAGHSLAPISLLPPELLIEVFSYCISSEPLVLLSLRQVSWWWRELVDSSPRLWQLIVLDDGDARFSEQQAALWTERSKPLKYDVELNIDDPDYILPLLCPLLPSIDRWRTFQLSGKRNEEIVMDKLQISPDSLKNLHLCMHDLDQDDFDDDDRKVTFSPISPDETDDFALNIWIAKLPPRDLLPPLRFVHVTIAEGGSIGLHTQPKFILEFLTACPDLESFYLSGFPHHGAIEGPLPLVELPYLITLHLKSTCFVRTILSCLYTPRLKNLYLSHLNVDFELAESLNEIGDSDDEAQDYSQSPSSDRATGMGLRKLIQRSRPPIRILEMDFCDMRTKDFTWVFQRLPFLEDFYIVASDMSNKVIDLLAPVRHLRYTNPGMTLNIFEEYGAQVEETVSVRLPRLQRLRLMNCQRLTGKAIVDALSKRVRWTDRHADSEGTLMDVTISGCDGFSQWDRHALSLVLQGRLSA